jgi:hypothetical protein
VLAAVNALGENQREIATRVGRLDERLGRVETQVASTGERTRSIEENLAEVKDLLVRALDR